MSYTVLLERDEDHWWIARVHGVQGVHSNGRTIEEAMRRVREALSLAIDDAEEVELIADVKLPSAVKTLLRKQADARSRAARQQEEASELQTKAARELTQHLGLSLRDAGALMGVSHAMAAKAARSTRGHSGKRAASRRSRAS